MTMKPLNLLLLMFLTGCVSMQSYNNEQVRTQCAIGYHEDQTNGIVLFKSKSKNEDGDKDKDEDENKVKESRFTEDIRCVPNSDKDRFINHHSF